MELLLRLRCDPATPEPAVWDAARDLADRTDTVRSAVDPAGRSFSLHRECAFSVAEELGVIMRAARLQHCTVLTARCREGTEDWRDLRTL